MFPWLFRGCGTGQETIQLFSCTREKTGSFPPGRKHPGSPRKPPFQIAGTSELQIRVPHWVFLIRTMTGGLGPLLGSSEGISLLPLYPPCQHLKLARTLTHSGLAGLRTWVSVCVSPEAAERVHGGPRSGARTLPGPHRSVVLTAPQACEGPPPCNALSQNRVF